MPSIPGDLIVIDFGTATTFDVVDSSGAYKGGIIAPGSISRSTRWSMPRPSCRGSRSKRRGRSVIGRTTESQMLIGIYWGYVAMIEGLTERIKARDRPAGDGRRDGRPRRPCSTSTRVFDAIEPDLTIQGLSLLHGMAARSSAK